VNRVAAAALALALLGGVAPISSASGASAAEQTREQQIASELKRLQGDIQESYAQENRVLAELLVSQRNRKALDSKVAALDASLSTAQGDLDTVNTELEQATATALAASAQVDLAKDQLETSTSLLKDQAINAYIRYSIKPSIPEAVASVEDVNEVPRVIALAEAVGRKQVQVVEKHKRLQDDLAGQESAAKAAKEAVVAERARVEQQKAALQDQQAAQASARAQAQAEEANERRLLAQIQAGRAADEQRVREMQATSDSITAMLRQLQRGQSPAPTGKGIISYPIAPPSIVSEFGWRTHPIFGDQRLHAGADFLGSTGQPIIAAADGTVAFSGVMTGYGNTVIVDHGRSLATLYAHQSRISVSNGQKVKKGQVIGYVGSTGYVTGPHLHLEVRAGGSPVNPREYL
jgi:murein DD-endopeptidase MepM/ murein hydrolase activator NlpD